MSIWEKQSIHLLLVGFNGYLVRHARVDYLYSRNIEFKSRGGSIEESAGSEMQRPSGVHLRIGGGEPSQKLSCWLRVFTAEANDMLQ